MTYIVKRPRLTRDSSTRAALALSVDVRHKVNTSAHHPGEVLAHQLDAVGVTATELARQLHVPANRITQIINGKRGITGDSALRLAHWFGTTPEFWMNLQIQRDLRVAAKEVGRDIKALPTRSVLHADKPVKHSQAA